MKQPIINFFFYFGRFVEVKKIKTKQTDILNKINSSTLINEKDKIEIIDLIYKLANPKILFFISPVKTSSTEIPKVRNIQDIIASYLPKSTSKNEYQMLEKTLSATNDYFRYHEMFEQNILFWMFVVIIATIFITPLLVLLL